MKNLKFIFPLFLSLFFLKNNLTGQTKMLNQPAISKDHIAFIYAEDLWVANQDGSNPKRLTISSGTESNPTFSPDGKWIAFSGEYDGNIDVFKIPVAGGVPTRLTWHPDADWVRGFTPDGKIVFASRRSVFTRRYHQFFTININGGQAEPVVIPSGWRASFSPVGNHIAYTPKREVFNQWKNYRGGTASDIWIISLKDHGVIEIPQPKSTCNDTDPVWMGNKVYFRSDRNGEFNLFSYDVESKAVTQLTEFNDFPINRISGGNKKIIFEQEASLHIFDPATAQIKNLSININADLLELREQFVSGNEHIRSLDISPSGKRVVFDFRGEVITLPAAKGDAKNWTQTSGVHEKYPSYSPDGKTIAYFSDASGEYELHLLSNDGKNNLKKFKLSGNGFYAYISWSPDSKNLCFVDNGRVLYLFNIASGQMKKIDADEIYFPGDARQLFGDWSGDSKWILYTKIMDTNYEKVFMYSVDQQKSFPITDGLSNATNPKFDREGKYLYFFASTDAGPVVHWFAQSNNDMQASRSIYLATLQKETISPFFKENDEEEGEQKDEKKEDKKEDADKNWTIDFDGMENRILAVPVDAGRYDQLAVAKSGALLYLDYGSSFSEPTTLQKFDFGKREDSEVMKADGFSLSANGEKMVFRKGMSFGTSAAGEAPAPGKGMLNTSALEVKINPKAEWKNIFDEAWRINRDYFYDPGMHGADWNAMKTKYQPFLEHLSCKTDLYKVIQWMCSEVGVGHHRFNFPGKDVDGPKRVRGGLLGADYSIDNNRYQFKKIYGGLNWNPDLRSPLTEPGVNIKEGEYLLAVNGKDLTAAQNIYSHFENTAGKIVELKVSSNPNGSNARMVKVIPISNESALRNRAWVEGNLKRVHEATNGQVAYVYVPNTAGAGHEYFKRYFFPQANKKAIIVDERFNGGGQIADYYIDILLRPYQSMWNFRYGKDIKTPTASIQGPKIMLIDENAGSGGDMLPFMFRKFKVGTMIGKRTWGGLVGVLGYPEFIDGGTVTAPNVAIWTEDGYIVENVGVAPDIDVEQTPSEIIQGKDPQLERAIEEALKQLKQNPPKVRKRPDYPIRVRKN